MFVYRLAMICLFPTCAALKSRLPSVVCSLSLFECFCAVRAHAEEGNVRKMFEVMKQAKRNAHVQAAACRALARAMNSHTAAADDRLCKQLQAAAKGNDEHADAGDMQIKVGEGTWNSQLVADAAATVRVSMQVYMNMKSIYGQQRTIIFNCNVSP
jgi:hypothetical protein